MSAGRAALASCALIAAAEAAPAPRMVKGPYLQALAPTSVTVMWQLDEPRPARLVVSGPGGDRVHDVAAAPVAEAAVTGLAPGTRYRYRLTVGERAWDGELATAPPLGRDAPFAFAVVGDTRYGADPHRRIAERIAREAVDFVLGTGDMVDDGARQDEWQTFFDVAAPLLRDRVFFPALGNHDRQGRGRTAEAYRAYFAVPEAGGDGERYYAFGHAAARFVVLDSNVYSFALTDQTAWLERELLAARQDPRVRHVFVVMHHPPFSISLHGGAVDLRERWTPLFERFGVAAVFSGHDHVYTRAEHHGVRYFVSGGGGAPLYPRRARPSPADAAAVRRFERAHHYLRVTVTGGAIEVAAIRTDGTVIETTAWSEPAAPRPAPAQVGAAPPPVAPAPVAVAPPPPERAPALWIGLAAVGALLGAAVVVVRTLRR